jgi:hypothetical protein
VKINAESTFYKIDVPDTGFLKVNGDATFIKLNVADIVAKKIVAESITTTPSTIG